MKKNDKTKPTEEKQDSDVQEEKDAKVTTEEQVTAKNEEEKIVEEKAPTEIDYEQKYKELNDSHLRLMAEFDNYRRRTMREKVDIIKNAGEKIITEFLPIVDNFERALDTMNKSDNVESIKQGVNLIYQQLMKMLEQNGVKPIETENKPFDTEFHEALTTIPAPSEDLKDKIVDCTTKGYTMNDKVIRHSKVVVGK